MKEWLLKNVIGRNNKFDSNAMRKIPAEIIDNIKTLTHFLLEDESVSCRARAILNDVVSDHKCECGNKTRYDQYKGVFKEYCSTSCANTSTARATKISSTWKSKPLDEINARGEKSKATCLVKYGVEFSTQDPTTNALRKKTTLVNYGVENPSSSIVIKEKKKETEKKNASAEKRRLKMSSLQTEKRAAAFPILEDKNALLELYKTKTIIQIGESLGCAFSTVNNALARFDIERNRHQFCSGVEKELREFIEENYTGTVISNYRNGKEIDVFLPELCLGFEMDGVYWHSDIDKNYHVDKTNHFLTLGISIVHILDTEWLAKRDIVKSRILSMIKTTSKMYARKTDVRDITQQDEKEFLTNNHIQGYVRSNRAYGLYHNDELVSLMTFGAPRFDNSATSEMLRFCSKLNCTVVGAASKLFSHFIKTESPISVVSYADRRWGEGDVYHKLGFSFSHSSRPSYFYLANGKLESRQKYQKHKLSSILPAFDSKLTEMENMKNNGFRVLYDCGANVYKYTNNKGVTACQ